VTKHETKRGTWSFFKVAKFMVLQSVFIPTKTWESTGYRSKKIFVFDVPPA